MITVKNKHTTTWNRIQTAGSPLYKKTKNQQLAIRKSHLSTKKQHCDYCHIFTVNSYMNDTSSSSSSGINTWHPLYWSALFWRLMINDHVCIDWHATLHDVLTHCALLTFFPENPVRARRAHLLQAESVGQPFAAQWSGHRCGKTPLVPLSADQLSAGAAGGPH